MRRSLDFTSGDFRKGLSKVEGGENVLLSDLGFLKDLWKTKRLLWWPVESDP